MKKSGDSELKHEGFSSVYKSLLNSLDNAATAMFQAEQKERTGDIEVADTGEYRHIQVFTDELNRLMFLAYPKFEKSKNVDVPDEIDQQIDDDVPRVDSLSFEEKKKLLYRFRELFESLKITSFERSKYEEEGFGRRNKEDDKR